MRIPRVPNTARGLPLLAAFVLAGQLPAQERQPAAPSPSGSDSKAAPAPQVKAPEATKAPQPGAPDATKAPQPGAPRALNGQPSLEVKRTSDPQAVAIVDNYIKALGGKEVLSKIKDRTTKFTNIKHSATGETKAEINLLLKDGIFFREEWEIK